MRSKDPIPEPAPSLSDLRARITRPEEADQLVRTALTALDALEPLIEQETSLMRIGKVRDALGMAMKKHDAAQRYTRCLELLKGNAIAIGRFKPDTLELLRRRHEVFTRTMSVNMAVVSTARTVSEGLIRDLADAMGTNRGVKTYAPAGVTRKMGTIPLAVSKMS
jgi:hypothetical protein